jgi:hypothetical protein
LSASSSGFSTSTPPRRMIVLIPTTKRSSHDRSVSSGHRQRPAPPGSLRRNSKPACHAGGRGLDSCRSRNPLRATSAADPSRRSSRARGRSRPARRPRDGEERLDALPTQAAALRTRCERCADPVRKQAEFDVVNDRLSAELVRSAIGDVRFSGVRFLFGRPPEQISGADLLRLARMIATNMYPTSL